MTTHAFITNGADSNPQQEMVVTISGGGRAQAEERVLAPSSGTDVLISGDVTVTVTERQAGQQSDAQQSQQQGGATPAPGAPSGGQTGTGPTSTTSGGATATGAATTTGTGPVSQR